MRQNKTVSCFFFLSASIASGALGWYTKEGMRSTVTTKECPSRGGLRLPSGDDPLKRDVFVVLSQTGTALSRALKRITGDAYNHSSISLDPELKILYSFGRRNPYNPFWGGFVEESPDSGTFKRFGKTKILVIRLSVDESVYRGVDELLQWVKKNKNRYSYNYGGLFWALWGKTKVKKNAYYCSEFVRAVLKKFHILPKDQLNGIVRPMDFMQMDGQIVFTGALRAFASDAS